MAFSIKPFIYTLVMLLFTVLIFETTSLDLFVQNSLYDFTEKHWLLSLDKGSMVHFIFYDGIKALLIIFALILLVLLLFFRKRPWVKERRKGLMTVLLSLIFIPMSVGIAKDISNVACPYKLTAYGGRIPYVGVFESYPDGLKPAQTQRCFPAAHASGGFALLSLFFLARTKKGRTQAVAAALSVGWLMGGYKMLIGHHFLSHTLVSMIFSWLIICCIACVLHASFFRQIHSFIDKLRFLLDENS
ncbi:phosphatase PAP2 family protein [Marinomonas sp. 15G1-11]|uniref:Phosphatase PAP2 family protein n=1 Tax=Marinomonas phaeophyticola TaxID=3004091 RepID=A0ABT4JRM8_9GAMM|nr:phosphatase PAP2 family protein [Marinomonas sp. 15G1-11]MCZ2721012.1 phosphatase PAP2 family protein [Marinomonas sp. 15G1-11]